MRLLSFPLFCLILLGFFLSGIAASSPAFAAGKKKPQGPNLKYASIVIDADSGMVLSQENADRVLHPASLTKIMTMALVFDGLNAGKITSKTRLVASSHGSSMPPSRVGLRPGQTITVYDALRTLATKSANDVAVTVAENLGGSEGRFVHLMNLKARQIGMSNTRFVNASGLHDYRQVSSARDMAKLAKYVIDTYPNYYPVFGVRNYRYNGKSLHNHNRLMESYQGMDGIKTGYVAASGFNLVASAKRGNTRIIGVVFGGRTATSRNEHMRDLMDRGFSKMAQLRASGRIIPTPTQSAAAVIPRYEARDSGQSIPLPPRKPWVQPTISTPAPQQQVIAQNSYPPTNVPVMKSLQITPVLRETHGTQVAHNLGQITVPASPSTENPPLPVQGMANWQIQIGAYEDRANANHALYNAMVSLPKHLNKGQTFVVPLRTSDARWVFRARLGGYTEQDATQACSYLKDCLTIPPQN